MKNNLKKNFYENKVLIEFSWRLLHGDNLQR